MHWLICHMGTQVGISTYYCIYALVNFILSKIADLDEMLHSIWVYTFCLNIWLLVSSMNRVNGQVNNILVMLSQFLKIVIIFLDDALHPSQQFQSLQEVS